MDLHDYVTFLSESEIDDGIRIGRFCRIHRFADSPEGEKASDAYYKNQMDLIEDLERRLEAVFADRVFISDNVWPSELLKVEVGSNEITKQFVSIVMRFLIERRTRNCVNVVVLGKNINDKETPFLGRILVSLKGLTIEESLKSFVRERLGIGE